jgi:hypothetical protein
MCACVSENNVQSLSMILNTPLEDLGMQDTMTFSSEDHQFGEVKTVDLIPDGRNIYVTDDNKADYVRFIAHHRLTTSFRKQACICMYSFVIKQMGQLGKVCCLCSFLYVGFYRSMRSWKVSISAFLQMRLVSLTPPNWNCSLVVSVLIWFFIICWSRANTNALFPVRLSGY